MEYRHRFTAHAPLEDVLAFHRTAGSLKAISPPLFRVSGLEAPDCLEEGSRIGFKMWLGPLPLRWVARIENFDDTGFDDVQLEGPFASWTHRHRFHANPDGTCQVDDHVSLALKAHPLWWPVGLLMALGLPLLFGYRARKTNLLLARSLN